MMDVEIMLLGLLITSTLTGLATEAIKELLDESKISYSPNLLAGLVSIIISIATGIIHVVSTSADWTSSIIVRIIVFVFLSWLCAMLGYDKVIQTISQIKKED